MALSLSANAQGEAFPEGFIDKSLTEAEGYTEWIPEPPKFTGGEFANDFYYYQWGRGDERKRTGGYLCNLGRERSAYNCIGDAGHSAVRWRSPRDCLVVRARFHRRLERQQEGEKQVSAHPSVRHVQGPTKVSISRTGINTSVNNAWHHTRARHSC